MAKRTVYEFLKKKYPKHLVLFAKNNKIYRYQYDYYLYQKYKNISYIIVNNKELIKRSYKVNCYDEAIIKYKLCKVLREAFIK